MTLPQPTILNSLICGAALSAMFATTPSQAQAKPALRTVLEVGNPDFRAYPIAVAHPRAQKTQAGETASNVIDTIRWDLGASPVFKVLNSKSFIANPQKEGMTAASIKFSDWINVGADGLVKIAATVNSGRVKVDLKFFDVGTGRELLAKSESGKLDDTVTIAHKLADAIVYNLTGSKGIYNTKIAVVRKTRKGRELYTMGVDGKRRRAITKNGSINLLPAWSTDGQALLFTSYIRHNPNLYRISASGGRPKLLSGERGLNTGGAMSPDGKRLALTLSRDGNSEIYSMNANGTGLKRLTKEWAIDSSPAWSPNGKRIAFVSSRWGDPQIFVMNADGSGIKRLTDRGTYNQTPDWSSKGDLIAFTARDERNKFDIFTVNPKTKEIARLTQDEGNNEEPSFSPDGNHIAFTSTREGKSQVWIMAFDGSKQRRITKEGGYSTPSWSPYLP
jgi:TolB protein